FCSEIFSKFPFSERGNRSVRGVMFFNLFSNKASCKTISHLESSPWRHTVSARQFLNGGNLLLMWVILLWSVCATAPQQSVSCLNPGNPEKGIKTYLSVSPFCHPFPSSALRAAAEVGID